MKNLIQRLKQMHRAYEEDCTRERFHLDAYAGTGGFSGRVRASPSSYWGWSADAYSDADTWDDRGGKQESELNTYLDRFPREDLPKFRRRAQVVHYENHVQPCIDIPLSYMRRKEFTREGDEGLQTWLDDATGEGLDWNSLVMGDVAKRGMVTGVCPVFFDFPALPPEIDPEIATRATDQMLGRQPRAIPLLQCNILDYDGTASELSWVKIRLDYCDRPDPLGPMIYRTEIRIVTKTDITLYVIERPEGEEETLVDPMGVRYTHPFGRVPLLVFRPHPVPGDPIRGVSMIQSIAAVARRLFNLHSELDEHIRSSVFSFLQVPAKNPASARRVTAGNGAALTIDPESKQPYAFISPNQDVSTIIEKRIENATQAIYAMARLSFVRGQIVGAAASGISRAYEFESTNRSVVDVATSLAGFDQDARRLMLEALTPGTDLTTVLTSAAKSYDIEDIDKELSTLESAARQRLGSRAITLMRQRVAQHMLDNVSPEDRELINAQILELAESEAKMQMQGDALAGMGGAFPLGASTSDPQLIDE